MLEFASSVAQLGSCAAMRHHLEGCPAQNGERRNPIQSIDSVRILILCVSLITYYHGPLSALTLMDGLELGLPLLDKILFRGVAQCCCWVRI